MGVARAFLPTDLTGLQLWLDANDASTLFQDAAKTISAGDGDVVGAWANKSSSGKPDATMTTTSQKPTLRTGVVNGLPIVRFDGADDHLDLGDYSALTAGEIFVVIKVAADPPAETEGPWLFGSDGSNFSVFPFFVDGIIYDAFGTTSRKTTVNPATTLAQFNLYNAVSIAGEWTNYLNGAQLFTTGTNTAGFNAACKLAESKTNLNLTGDYAELVLFDNKLSAGDKTTLKSYFADKYELTIA